MSEITVSSLVVYPVKSMRGIEIESAAIDMGGLENDRRWMVVDNDGVMVTQRELSKLCLIQPQLLGGGIRLQTVGMSDIEVPVPADTALTKVKVWNDGCNAVDAGDGVSRWLSQCLGIECNLVYFPQGEIRIVDQTYALAGDRTAFSDGFPILLLSLASLEDLNLRLDVPVPMARFRPNIVVSGCLPYAEDNWTMLKLGDLAMRIVKPCSRCVIPSIDIESAERTREPTKTLSRYRRANNEIRFGQNALIDGRGEIRTGQVVEIIA